MSIILIHAPKQVHVSNLNLKNILSFNFIILYYYYYNNNNTKGVRIIKHISLPKAALQCLGEKITLKTVRGQKIIEAEMGRIVVKRRIL